MNIAMIGYGNVGRGFTSLLNARKAFLAEDYGFEPKITAILTRHGGALDPRGISLNGDIPLKNEGTSFEAALASCDVVVEITPTNVQTGGAGLDHIRQALKAGRDVVTANKGPLVVAYRELAALAQRHSCQFRFEGTVMGGTPSMVLGLETLKAAGVKSVRGIVNGTTNYILTTMEAGGSYASALMKAQELGYAEADPTSDVEGWDAAAKAVILANALMAGNLSIGDVDREGITGISSAMIEQARAAGQRWKLIVEVSAEGAEVKASVRPQRLPVGDPLALVGGGMNALTYSTQAIGDVTLIEIGRAHV
jgi:homoserine dehydrogenase